MSTKQRLEEEKLREEVRKLRREGSAWHQLSGLAGTLTGAVAVGGLIFTALKFFQDRDKERQQTRAEHHRRIAESFDTTLDNLGAESQGLQASAAVALLTFLDEEPEHEVFLEQVFLLALAHLKIEHAEPVRRLLLRVFEKAARRYVPTLSEEDRPLVLDLARVKLDRVNLSGIDLRGADIAFASLCNADLSGAGTNLREVAGIEVVLDKARLSRANLNEARLKGAHAHKTHFHETNLVAARLGDADLREAQFQRAKLQGADFRGAKLQGARFAGAIVSDADFRGATFDDSAIRELLKTNWRKTDKLDPEIKARLEELSAESAEGAPGPSPSTVSRADEGLPGAGSA